ncbi:MAG: hypothetical protein KA807_02805 [Prolixibacteraceae bacterium]|nr:hypothetical protein [Prolixibacteraceae bacterium]
MENICPSYEKCPIFNGILSDKEMTSTAYRKIYCESGDEKWTTCKRFMVKQSYGACPPDLLPNSTYTVEQIAAKYNLKK